MVLSNAPTTAAVSAGVPGCADGVGAGVVAGVVLGAVLGAVVELLAVGELPVPAADPPPGRQAAVARPAAVTTAPAAIPVTRRMLPSSILVPDCVPGMHKEFPSTAQDPT
jgi:hypothetical protein